MTSSFLQKVHAGASTRTVSETRTLRAESDFAGLSYYTMCALADTIGCVNPAKAIPARGEVWLVDLDSLGNFIRAENLGRTLPPTDRD